MYKFSVLFLHISRAYSALLYANLGDNVTLPCRHASSAKNLCWYKQAAGEQPQLISTFYKHGSNSFYNQFKDNRRFSIDTGGGFYHLSISNVQHLDSAMYYCGQTSVTVTEFYDGTFLVLKESGCRSFLQQPVSRSVQPGGSVTLNCTVQAGASDGEHSVYWFKKDTGNSRLGIMYIHEHGGSRCAEGAAPVQSCVYSFSQRNVKLSDAGTYHCAVASCGEILFGEGTKLDVEGGEDDTLPVLQLCVVAALSVSLTLNIILTLILCKMAGRTHLQPAGSCPRPRAVECTADTQVEEPDALQYVALDFKKRQGKSRRQRRAEEGTVYSGLRMTDLE